MKNYKAINYDETTFEPSEIETKIPNDLVENMKELLGHAQDYYVTPVMVNPDDLSVSWGLMSNNDRTLKYKISITPHQENK